MPSQLNGFTNHEAKPQSEKEETSAKKFLVEVVQRDASTLDSRGIMKAVDEYIRNSNMLNILFPIKEFEDKFLSTHVESLVFCIEDESGIKDSDRLNLKNELIDYRVFKLNRFGHDVEEISTGDEESSVPAASHWVLPSQDFQGIWENLVYDSDIKNSLLRFVETTLVFADKKVDTNIVSCNRVVLLHGPPGTGKTSLCKALAQKLSIRMNDRYSHGQLIEINSHSLFSKWFSESGKLVQKMFTEIRELIDDPKAFVCVLMDEVESLTAARTKAMSGSEPSDAIRVVNALLTQLDSIRHYPNVLILTTSNITGAIDLAFVDRADIKQYVGPPSQSAIYKIYYSCVMELVRAGVVYIREHNLQPFQNRNQFDDQACEHSVSGQLWKVSGESVGLSGRTLRKIPFLAVSMFCDVRKRIYIDQLISALGLALNKQKQDRSELS